jgi:hypothetical protein
LLPAEIRERNVKRNVKKGEKKEEEKRKEREEEKKEEREGTLQRRVINIDCRNGSARTILIIKSLQRHKRAEDTRQYAECPKTIGSAL